MVTASASAGEDRPFVTIGVTTYNRKELLRQTLDSILAQTFTDFEVIVGNDYTGETLTGELLGISDPRIRFVNHPENLREVGNMNALLNLASGRYFTWQFDDDLYEPEFLQVCYDNLAKTGFPAAVFTSFRILVDKEEFMPRKSSYGPLKEFSGLEFLSWYSPFKTQVFSTYGLFDTATLKSRVGELEELNNEAVGLYSEYHYLVKCALLDRILYVDAPLYVFRQHEESWSESNTDLEIYRTSGKELIRQSSLVLQSPSLAGDFAANLLKVCCLHLIEYAHKSGRHVNYMSRNVREQFGIKAVIRTLSGHWRETMNIAKLYLTLGGTFGFRNLVECVKVVLFCNYLMTSHLCHFFAGRRKV